MPVHVFRQSMVITPVDVVCDLGVTLNSQLTMQQHVNKVARPVPTCSDQTSEAGSTARRT